MHHDTPLLRSAQIQMRVISALLMREILTRYGRHNVGFLWIFFEPMMFTLGVAGIWSGLEVTHGAALPIVAFAVTGYSTVLLWRNATGRCALAIIPNQSLLYHRNVRVLDIFLARILLEVSGATMSLVFLCIFFSIIGTMHPPADVTKMVLGWIYMAIFSTGLALTVGALTERSETVERIWHTTAYLMFPLSGAVFMVDWIPQKYQQYALWIPMVNGTELIRSGYFGTLVKPHYNVTYMIFVDLIMLAVGLFMVRDTSKRVEPE